MYAHRALKEENVVHLFIIQISWKIVLYPDFLVPEPIYPSVIQLRLDLTLPKQPDSNGDFCRVTDAFGV